MICRDFRWPGFSPPSPRGEREQLVLVSGGAASVGFYGPADSPGLPLTVVLPCNSSRVRTIAEACAAAASEGGGEDDRWRIGVSFRAGACQGSVHIFMGLVPGYNYLEEGIYKEMHATANRTLAVAIRHSVAAEEMARRGDERAAIAEYLEACSCLAKWDRQKCWRAFSREGAIESFLWEDVLDLAIRLGNGSSGDGSVLATYRSAWDSMCDPLFRVRMRGRHAVVSFTPETAARLRSSEEVGEGVVEFMENLEFPAKDASRAVVPKLGH